MAITYKEWVEENKEQVPEMWGIQSVITDALVHDNKVRDEVRKLASDALARATAENGLIPVSFSNKEWNDAMCKTLSEYSYMEVIKSTSELAYLQIAYKAWQGAENKLYNINKLSLWGHIKMWWKNK
jgi:hypothetical protein